MSKLLVVSVLNVNILIHDYVNKTEESTAYSTTTLGQS